MRDTAGRDKLAGGDQLNTSSALGIIYGLDGDLLLRGGHGRLVELHGYYGDLGGVLCSGGVADIGGAE